MNLNGPTQASIEKLAAEAGITPEALVEKLVNHYDSERHVQWQGSPKGHVRVKCLFENCFETTPRSPLARD